MRLLCVLCIRLTYREMCIPMYIPRMEIGRARRDALELYRSFDRFIDDDEYHIPVVRQCVSAFCCETKEKANTQVI